MHVYERKPLKLALKEARAKKMRVICVFQSFHYRGRHLTKTENSTAAPHSLPVLSLYPPLLRVIVAVIVLSNVTYESQNQAKKSTKHF